MNGARVCTCKHTHAPSLCKNGEGDIAYLLKLCLQYGISDKKYAFVGEQTVEEGRPHFHSKGGIGAATSIPPNLF